ncbi:MAG: hypothetical protein LAE24_07730 [Candidatus Contendobacter sp.]|nr:hypothetical protein [Candidatus Contendobacter sp.]
MSLPKPDLHLRISAEADVALTLIAEYEDKPKAEIAGQLLDTALLGHVYGIKLILRKAKRLGFAGNEGE